MCKNDGVRAGHVVNPDARNFLFSPATLACCTVPMWLVWQRHSVASGYDPVTMTHSAEPDDEQPHQPVSHAKPEPDETPAQPKPSIVPGLAVVVPTLIAVLALGIAIWALTDRPSSSPPSPTAQETADATKRACDAYGLARTAVALQTRADTGTDPVAAQAIAANARLAMAVGSQHLVDSLSPAVPSELDELLRSVASDLQGLAINALAGTTDGDTGQVARLHDLETTSARVVELCK